MAKKKSKPTGGKQMDPRLYAVRMLDLEPGDFGYSEGRRVRVEQLDGGEYTFRTMDEATKFMSRHGMYMVVFEELDKLRKDYSDGVFH